MPLASIRALVSGRTVAQELVSWDRVDAALTAFKEWAVKTYGPDVLVVCN